MSQKIDSTLSQNIITEEGTVGFDNLKINCVVGVHPHERHTEQKICVDLRVTADFSRCAATDQVKDAIDYEKLAKLCSDMAKTRKFQLLETMAWEILDEVFAQFDVSSAHIIIKKEKALKEADRSIVELKKRKYS